MKSDKFPHPMRYSADCWLVGLDDLLYAILFILVYARGSEEIPGQGLGHTARSRAPYRGRGWKGDPFRDFMLRHPRRQFVWVEVAFCVWIIAAQVWYYGQFRESLQAIVIPMLHRLWP